MNILILQGSPRAIGNTAWMAEEYKKAAEFHDICNYWGVEDSGIVTAKIDQQKTDDIKQKIVAIVGNL